MGKYPKAKVVPFSSVVGSSVTLHDPETERVIGQLAILNVGGDTKEDWKQRSIAVAEDTARRINAHDELVAALDGLLKANDAVQDVLCDGPEVPGFDPTALGRAQSLVTEAETVARLALSRAKGEA